MKSRFKIKDTRRFVFLSLLAFVALGLLVSRYQKTDPLPDGFYRIDRGELNALIVRYGVEDFRIWPREVQRDTLGTSLRLGSIITPKRIVVSCDGTIDVIDVPSPDHWLNEKKEVFSWASSGTDPSGRYFWQRIEGLKSRIFSTSSGLTPILELDNYHLKIYSTKDEVHVFGKRSMDSAIEVRIYEIEGEKLKIKEEYEINRSEKMSSVAIFVVDYNIDTGDIVIVNSQDPPFTSKWYFYNIHQNKFRYLGKASDNGFFLECDIPRAVSEEMSSAR